MFFFPIPPYQTTKFSIPPLSDVARNSQWGVMGSEAEPPAWSGGKGV